MKALRLILLVIFVAAVGFAAWSERSDPDFGKGAKKAEKGAMQSLIEISPGKDVPDEVKVIVEIPRGTINKYEYDEDDRVIKLDRVLGGQDPYPVEYGFIPRSRAPDGDPLDFIMLTTEPLKTGVLAVCRPIGVMKMIDGDDQDDKVLCVSEDPRMEEMKDLNDVPEAKLAEIALFFSTYKNAEGKTTSVPGWGDVDEAKTLIKDSLEAYKKEKKS